MDIGKEDAPYTIEPVESPIPDKELSPEPDPLPVQPDRELIPA